MRTTVTLDPDVYALVEAERAQTGESFKQAINRLLRRAARRAATGTTPLPLLPGGPVLDVSDVSALLSVLDDERRASRNIP
jgi:phytoene/squalene synthetase